jgi:hypothetical protein
MKSKFLKIAGVRSEEEFYLKYPTEEAFFEAHPEARGMRKGGTIEAFPQTITANNFFSYGVPAPPNYLKEGGMPDLYPQIQSEKQFFLPIYTNSNNAYAHGGTPEVFPQVGPVNYQPPVNMPLYMDEGGSAIPPTGYPVSQGVNNTTGDFVNWLKSKSYSASDKEATKNVMKEFKNGGHSLPYMEPIRTVADDGVQVNTNTTPSALSQNDFNKYMNTWFQSQMGQRQQQMPQYGYGAYNDMRGFVPSLYAYNFNPGYNITARNSQGLLGRGTSNMSLIHAIYPELYSGSKSFDDLSQDPNFKFRASTMGLKNYSERDRGVFGKRKERTFTFETPSAYNLDGKVGSGKLPDNIPSNYTGPSANNSSVSVPPVQGTPWVPDYLQPKPVDNSPMPGPVGMTFSPNPNLPANTQSNPLSPLGPGNAPSPMGMDSWPSYMRGSDNSPLPGPMGMYSESNTSAAPSTSRVNNQTLVTNFSSNPTIRRQQEAYNRQLARGSGIKSGSRLNVSPEGSNLMRDFGLTEPKDDYSYEKKYWRSMVDAGKTPEEIKAGMKGFTPEEISNIEKNPMPYMPSKGLPGGNSNYINSTPYDQYYTGGLVKAQGGFNFTTDDSDPGEMENPMGVTSPGMTENQMRNVIADDSFGINPTGKEYTTVTEKEKGPFAGMFSDFYTNQFYKRAVTNALNSRNKPDTMLIEDTMTGINPAMNLGQDPLSKKQVSNKLGNYAIQQDNAFYGKSGGQYNVGDEVEMTPEELQAFIQMGGQVDFI